MASFYGRVAVSAMVPFPAIRLQFQDDEFQREPASHVDVLIASSTADELIALLLRAREAQEEAASAPAPAGEPT